MKRFRRAFTLIELLIVVSIIAILSAIAIPNFAEATTRSKAARAHNDLRVLAISLEVFAADHNRYPENLLFLKEFPYMNFVSAVEIFTPLRACVILLAKVLLHQSSIRPFVVVPVLPAEVKRCYFFRENARVLTLPT